MCKEAMDTLHRRGASMVMKRVVALSSPEIEVERSRTRSTSNCKGVLVGSDRQTERDSSSGSEAIDVRWSAVTGAATLRWRRRGCDRGRASKSTSEHASCRDNLSRFGVEEKQDANTAFNFVSCPLGARLDLIVSSRMHGLSKRNAPMSIE